MIDPQNAGTATVYKSEMVDNLTTRRNMWNLMQVAPGVTVDNGDSLGPKLIAFGSNRQSNSWNVDGMDVTAPETGSAWWFTNPDIIDQIQIYGIGAPAEFGNYLGATVNVVTKKGSNNFHGRLNSFFQTQALTEVNVRLPDSDFVYHRNKYYDVSGQVGGPVLKDRIWYFGAIETLRDDYAPPGIDPIYAPLNKSDKYDFKITGALGSHYEINGFYHNELYDSPDIQSPYNTTSATGHIFGKNPAIGTTLTSVFSEKFLLELGYAGWWGHEDYGSLTNSLEEPYLNVTVSPNEASGGIFYPYDYKTFRHQVNGKATYYADQFLKTQHEFKFGVQFSDGSAATMFGYGPNGSYTYDAGFVLFRYYQQPYYYGGTSKSLGLFVDDSVTINRRLSLNVGLRFDRTTGSIPDYDELKVATPSVSQVMNVRPTGSTIPGIHNYVDWKMFSPRLGFVWQTSPSGRSAIRGSFGIYYDHNTIGNWDFPVPGMRPTVVDIAPPGSLYWEFLGVNLPPQVSKDQKLKPPRATEYSLGYEFQSTENSSIGVQYVHKDTSDLIGWHIIGGNWQPYQVTDPFTGKEYTFLEPDPNFAPATREKGNEPGDFPGSAGLRYFQTYDAAIATFRKRFADSWELNASYTWSRSYGLIPRATNQLQFNAFYRSKEGNNPNQYVNATGLLQGDRPSMFRAQVLFLKLPWDLQAASSIEFSSGRPYTRQIRGHGPNEFGLYSVNMEVPGSRRHSPVQNIDLSVGKRIPMRQVQLLLDAEILNLLNSNQELSFQTLALDDPSQTFVPDSWVQPRRVQLQIGVQF